MWWECEWNNVAWLEHVGTLAAILLGAAYGYIEGYHLGKVAGREEALDEVLQIVDGTFPDRRDA